MSDPKSVKRYSRMIIACTMTAAVLAAVIQWPVEKSETFFPWYVPIISTFDAFSFLFITVLTILRYKILRDSPSFWIGMGAAVYCVALFFDVLAWPGFHPSRGSIIADSMDAPNWFLQIGLTVLSIFWLLGVLLPQRAGKNLRAKHLLILVSGWTALWIMMMLFLLKTEKYLPVLVSPSGVWNGPLLIWNIGAALFFAAGSGLSLYRYHKTGDTLFGYIGMPQIGFALAMFVTVDGMRRYDLSWYVARIIPTGCTLSVIIGLLLDYVLLILRDKEQTAQLLETQDALLREREHAESERKRLEVVLELLPVAVFIADAKGTLSAANAAAKEIWGETPLSSKISDYKKDYKAWWIDTGRRVQSNEWGLVRALLKGERCMAQEMEIEARDGQRRFILNYAMPILEQGKISGSVAINVDITERVRAEQELRKLNDSLEAQVAERTALAKARARQLQSLAVELIETEERERRRFAELLHEDLQQMLASARYQLLAVGNDSPMLANVARILEESIAKSRRLAHELSPPILDHGSLFSAFEWLASQMNKNFGLHVQLASDTEIPPLEESPVKIFIFRAVQELLFNIVKHAGVDRAWVRLAKADGLLEITVRDAGKGFDKGVIDPSRSEKSFGLVTIQERIRNIGGRFEIESQLGQGSCFSLIVPIQPFSEESARRSPETPIRSALPQAAIRKEGGLRVLFADDHKVMRQGLIRLIADQPDIQVAGEAATGREALDLARRLQPDVIVMDISMPEMDGIEATRRIKAEFPGIWVIGLSMHEDEHVYRTMRDAGADAVLGKTASSAELLKAIYH